MFVRSGVSVSSWQSRRASIAFRRHLVEALQVAVSNSTVACGIIDRSSPKRPNQTLNGLLFCPSPLYTKYKANIIWSSMCTSNYHRPYDMSTNNCIYTGDEFHHNSSFHVGLEPTFASTRDAVFPIRPMKLTSRLYTKFVYQTTDTRTNNQAITTQPLYELRQ